ncbi:hypothetical protein PF007_g23917 [Phytophthora fragariae]|uniref:Uncharacterized protein n=1 Tax=Phytophthora fragariae TaxID=53985 RepID=A0A6A3QKA1_9STRA|nr:hypothetical protein PF007_g23917 [Phytophthora fragariae]
MRVVATAPGLRRLLVLRDPSSVPRRCGVPWSLFQLCAGSTILTTARSVLYAAMRSSKTPFLWSGRSARKTLPAPLALTLRDFRKASTAFSARRPASRT